MRKKMAGLAALVCCALLGGTVALAGGGATTHKVKKGDTLWDISGSHLKDPKAWPKVWKANPQIRNPDRIKPGQVVQLPGKATGKMQTVATPAPAPAPMPAIERSGPPLALTVIRDEPVKARSAAEEARILRHSRGVGEVTGELPGAGKVLGTQAGWGSDADGGTIFIQAADARVGAAYGVYRDFGKVSHPGTFRLSPGRLLAEIGTVEIVALQGDRQLAKITTSYDAVQQGDLLGPLSAPVPELTLRDRLDALEATVVAVESSRLVAGPQDIVYLDAGSEQGVVPGDRLRINGRENGNGRRQSAFVAVLAVTPTTAAVLVLPESDHQVHIGDTAGPAR
ncbi:MAG: LysM peptidoglycan-binding domain-containing protein [Thermodesulfobacteriota bacterium]